MRLSLKIRISLWYTFLLIILLALTLFATYKIVSFQLKREIISDLNSKSKIIIRTLNQEIESENSEEHHGREEHENHHQKKEKKTISFIEINELLDDRNILIVFEKDELKYLSNKYADFHKFIFQFKINDGEIKDLLLNNVPFSLTTFNLLNYQIYLGSQLSSLTELQSKMLNIFIIISPIAILLSFIFGFAITQGTMNVVKRINETTNSITSTNLTNRITVPKGKDEVTKLILTLNSMIDRIEKSFNQAKQFSQDAAHELRTPLTIIRGEIEELMENDIKNPKIRTKLSSVIEEVKYLSSISERLLLIHSMDTSKIKYHFKKINLSELMYEVYEDVKIISNEKNINISKEISENIHLNCNKELILRLLWNLTDNAIKYNIPNGQVKLLLSHTDISIIIGVSDTGIGIPKNDTEKVFERFYRVDKSRSHKLSGSGLGLSICKWIIDLHNGEIKLESEVNKGTNFIVKLPK